jgi:hypothetical protein
MLAGVWNWTARHTAMKRGRTQIAICEKLQWRWHGRNRDVGIAGCGQILTRRGWEVNGKRIYRLIVRRALSCDG